MNPARNTEAIEVTVVRPDINLTVGNCQSRKVVKRSDLIAAVPQLFSGHRYVKRKNLSLPAFRSTKFRSHVQTLIRPCLSGFLAAAVGENDPIRDDRRLPSMHIP